MLNSLSGKFYSNSGTEHDVTEAYARKDHPQMIFRKDKRGDWRAYVQVQKNGKKVFRAFGLRTPDFAK